MIEELNEYLMRHGYDSDIADEIHMAYYDGGIDGAVESFEWANDEKHDYTSELRKNIENWQKEVGED